MPNLEISTNVPRESIPEDFVLKILPILSEAMGRPEELFFVSLTTDVIQIFDKDPSAPTIVGSVRSVGLIGPEENRITARALTDFMEKELGVNRERILLSFIDMEASNVARGGNTFG